MATAQKAGTAILAFEMHHRLALTVEYGRVEVDELMDALGRSRNTILNYISGRTRPSKGDVNTWAQMAGVSFMWLWNGTDPDGEPISGSTIEGYPLLEWVTGGGDVTRRCELLAA
jgi:hypothetical protein